MYLYHNSRRLQYRAPFGAVPAGSAVTLSLDAQIPAESRVYLRLWQSSERLLPMTPDGTDRFSVTLTVPEAAQPAVVLLYHRHAGATSLLRENFYN